MKKLLVLSVALTIILSHNFHQCAWDTTIDPNSNDNLIVQLPNLGFLKGSTSRTALTNETIYQFLGIKYAESPSGLRRFKAPVPVSEWSSVRNAEKHGEMCPQWEIISKLTEVELKSRDLEDCLSLSVYTKNLDEKAKRPVMVYIHGGGFYEGGAKLYTADYYLESDIVFVVPQYRLDSIGFLSTQSDDIPGNAAALDVILALQWVQQNIKHFGGDSSKVTVVGQSSGATMISVLAVSVKVPENLFQRIILQSGSALPASTYDFDPVQTARDLGAHLGISSNASLMELNQALMQVDVRKLLEATDQLNLQSLTDGTKHSLARRFSLGGPTNLLPKTPYDLYRSGQVRRNLQVLIGVTKHDGSFFTSVFYDFFTFLGKINNKDFIKNDLIPMLARLFDVDDDAGGSIGSAQKLYWTREQWESGDYKEYTSGITDFLGTVFLKAPALRLARFNSQFAANNTYLYTYNYRGQFTRIGFGSHYPFDGGIHHSDDNINLFTYPDVVPSLNTDDTEMSRKMVNFWTSFAAMGQPKACRDCEEDKIPWLPFSGPFGPYLRIDKQFSIGNYFIDEFTAGIDEVNSNKN